MESFSSSNVWQDEPPTPGPTDDISPRRQNAPARTPARTPRLSQSNVLASHAAPMSSTHNDARDERSPLLDPRRDAEADETILDAAPPRHMQQQKEAAAKRLLVIILCVLLSVVFGIASTAFDTAMLQVQEDILCERSHASRHCDDDPGVQAQLSVLRSWATLFDLIPGLVAAVPLGLVADERGRSLVLGLCFLGMTASMAFQMLICAVPTILPLRLVWLGSAFNFIGGGETVFDAMIHAILADISNEAQRATAFFYLGAALTLGAIAGGPITYWLMLRGAWLPLSLALCGFLLCVIIAFSMPETLEKAGVEAIVEQAYAEEEEERAEIPKSHHAIWAELRVALKRFGEFLHLLVTKERRIGFVLLSLLLSCFSRDSTMLLQQYVKAKLKWSWGEAGLVDTVQSVCNMVLLSILLPLIAQLLLRILSPRQKDMWLARGSILLQATGSFGIGLARTPLLVICAVVVNGLGFGFNLIARAMIASVMSSDIGALFSFVAVLETATVALANPLLAAAFRAGLKLGDPWLGLPFLLAGFSCLGALVIVTCVRVG